MLTESYFPNTQYQDNMLAEAYIKLGHKVTIITSTINDIFDFVNDKYNKTISASKENVNGVKVTRLPFSINVFNKIRCFSKRKIIDILDAEQPDFVFSHGILLNLTECIKYKKENPLCKLIMDYHADYSNSAQNWLSLNFLHKIIWKSVLYLALNYVDKIYPVTPCSLAFLHDVYGIPFQRMSILPLGCDMEKAKEVMLHERGKVIRERLNIPEDAFVVFTAGKLDPLKKTNQLIEAFLQLSDPQLYLIIVGIVRPGYENFKREIEKLAKNNKKIYFVGWVDGNEIYQYMNASDVAIFPGTQSVLWQQSIGMGLPLIISEVIENDGNKITMHAKYLDRNNNILFLNQDKISEFERVNEISQIIQKLMKDPILMKKMKTGAIKTAEEYLDYMVIARQTLE